MTSTRFIILSITLLLGISPGLRAEETGVKPMRFGMQAILTAHPDRGEELAEVMLRASELASKAGGCELYVVQISSLEDTKVLITEVWESQEAHQASLTDPEIRELITSAKPLIAGMEHHPAKPLGGLGID